MNPRQLFGVRAWLATALLACAVGIPFVAAHPASAISFTAAMDDRQESTDR